MASLIDDEVLNAFAVVADLDDVPARLLDRFGGVVDRTSFYAPPTGDPQRLQQLVGALRSPVRAVR